MSAASHESVLRSAVADPIDGAAEPAEGTEAAAEDRSPVDGASFVGSTSSGQGCLRARSLLGQATRDGRLNEVLLLSPAQDAKPPAEVGRPPSDEAEEDQQPADVVAPPAE